MSALKAFLIGIFITALIFTLNVLVFLCDSVKAGITFASSPARKIVRSLQGDIAQLERLLKEDTYRFDALKNIEDRVGKKISRVKDKKLEEALRDKVYQRFMIILWLANNPCCR